MRLLLSPQDSCSYLPDRQSASLFVDPCEPLNMQRYAALLNVGFRRSGPYVYRPHCEGCQACVPARVPVADFQANRSQRRNLRDNGDVAATPCQDRFGEHNYRMYQAYQQRRHPGGTMALADRGEFAAFLSADWATTEFCEFHSGDESLGVCVYDRVANGLSAVYTYYSEAGERRGLGKFAVLWLIDEARRHKLPYVYLGYWISQCTKMSYKAEFQPLELLIQGDWRTYPG
ncbi:MAG: arginyltransferase [Gammaproteobacteria bacterium]|nr:arginyltransferase [Gammaproteobacteria bacterium]